MCISVQSVCVEPPQGPQSPPAVAAAGPGMAGRSASVIDRAPAPEAACVNQKQGLKNKLVVTGIFLDPSCRYLELLL